MPRYIDVDNAIYRLKKLALHDSQPRAIIRGARYLAEFAEEATPDVQEVKHGKWAFVITTDFGCNELAYECSLCGEKVVLLSPKTITFCPNCGAKMDKEST